MWWLPDMCAKIIVPITRENGGRLIHLCPYCFNKEQKTLSNIGVLFSKLRISIPFDILADL